MFAIVETGGKQIRVAKGDKIKVEKLNGKEGDKIVLDKVLLLAESDEKAVLGKPLVDGASVEAKILSHDRAKKIIVFKFKPKKRYQKKQGHRQDFTEIEITKIKASNTKKTSTKKAEKKTATKKKPATKKKVEK